MSHHGRLIVTVEHAFLLRRADFFGLSDPFAVVSLYSGKKYAQRKQRTHTIKNTLNPTWNSKLEFQDVDVKDATIYLEIFDEDLLGSADILGNCRVPIPTGPSKVKVYRKLVSRKQTPVPGAVIFNFEWQPSDQFDQEVVEAIDVKTLDYQGLGALVVKVVEAQDLKPLDPRDACNTFVEVRCVQQEKMAVSSKRTSVDLNDMSPIWDEAIRFNVDFELHTNFVPLELEVFRETAHPAPNESLGVITVDVPTLTTKLKSLRSIGNSSTLLFEVYFEPFGSSNVVFDDVQEHIDPDAVPNIFSLRGRLADTSMTLYSTCQERDKWKKMAEDALHENERLSRLNNMSDTIESQLKRQLDSALARNERLRLELRHADEIFTDDNGNLYQSGKVRKRANVCDGLELGRRPPISVATSGHDMQVESDAPQSPLMSALSKQSESPNHDQACANGSSMWLLFNRIIEEWGPKVRNEKLSSLLEGAVHPSRTYQVTSLMSLSSDLLTFDDFLEIMIKLEVRRSEWKCLVRLVRNISAR